MLDKLKKNLWAVGLAATTLSALLGALATNHYVAEQLAPPEKVEGLPPPGASRRPVPVVSVSGAPAEPEEGGSPVVEAPLPSSVDIPTRMVPDLCSYESVLSRNLFDAETSLRLCVEETQSGEEQAPVIAPLALRLFGTALANPMQFSWALISKDENNAATEVFRVGDDLYAQGTLKEVRRNQIVVNRPDGTEQVVNLYTGQSNTTEAPIPAEAGKTDSPALGDSIRKVGENKYEVDAREIQNALDNMDKLASAARIVPSYENGAPIGFKVFRIKPNSFYSKLGIRNGDVVKKINGFEINSTEKALQMYQLLRTEKNLKVELTRRGQPVTTEVSIR